ncbi:GmrSD restriction endonuclease domain-containing protein [Chlorogloea sp. CCALA 695]|uniref:GmrSD restriction endonuclease domain-containing protein n=1 Tax=Chlorogloea sp. CCALA 695 TaxID=2107693 RepID=UPI000D07F816|nr:DUF262 domain-containing protein [Chlorogloea sp. CCALA 695]PSB28679.1 hypothetical protein C7B70_20410 [Chlorogloea sp. CCALA 695]
MNDKLTEATDEIQFEAGEEVEESLEGEFLQSERTIRTNSADPEIESLHGKWKRGRLVLQPFFQRQYVWDSAKASRLIESALLCVPLPIIYLAEELDNTESVIDGQQRLTSFFSFIDGNFPNGQPFRLSRMKVFPELNKKKYSDLSDELQDKIRYYQIRTVTIRRDSDPDLKFEIFERLNTGAMPLNEMELRNCVYRGSYIKLLKELAEDEVFTELVGIKKPDKRMKDIELVLRFSAFYHSTYLKYQSPMKRFFNQDMEKYKNINEHDATALRDAFKNSVQIIKSLFDKSAFKRFRLGTQNNPNGLWEAQQFNTSIYDVLMGVFYDKDKNQVYAALDAIREGLINLMTTNQDFIDAITLGTSEVGQVRKRFDLTRMLVDSILLNYHQQPRCFSLQLKQELYETDPTCQICGQKIQNIDDAAIDHIHQYWQGGQTIPENARLTHRYCNMARSRNN